MGILATEYICNSASVTDAFFIPEWQYLSILALVASAGLLALAYMLNRLTNNDEGQTVVKIELFELFATAFVIITTIGLVQASCEITMGSLISPDYAVGMNVFDAAAAVLQDFSESLAVAMTFLHIVYIPVDFQTTTTLTMQPLGLGTVIQPTSGIGAIVKPAMVNAIQAMALAYIVIRAELFVLDFTSYAFITFYLPLGIILRSFTPTRRIGGTIMGLVIGLVIFFPLLIVFNGLVAFSIWPTNPLSPTQTDLGFIDSLTNPFTGIFDSITGIGDIANPFTVFYLINQVIGAGFGSLIGALVFFFMRSAGAAFFIGLFFPALNTLLLVVIVRYITKYLGEEIDVTNLTRLV